MRADHNYAEPGRCVMDRKPVPPGALYCSQACTQRAYRRRRASERAEELRRAERDAEHQRQAEWCRLLMDRASLSRKQAERVFVVLDEFGRIDGSPWEQQALKL